jgi:cell division protein FtsI/penicillin-binding protein 2
MKHLIGLLSLFFICHLSSAQGISKADLKDLQQKEDSIRSYSVKIIQGINASDRLDADSMFTRMLVRALKIKNAFHYPFESLQTISILYSPDSMFRIFTWQLVINENVIRQHGAIQMKTYDGSLKLYPLIDKSDVTINVADTIGNNFGWIGAI